MPDQDLPTACSHAVPCDARPPQAAAGATPIVSNSLRRAQIIHEIMEHRYLQAFDRGNPEEIARAEMHLVNAVRRCQEATAPTNAPRN